jgi:2-methylcitrate dehydratase PrpD
MTESTTEDLARFAASVKYENIPAPAREYCKDILLDTLACAFAGHFGEETDQILGFFELMLPPALPRGRFGEKCRFSNGH